MDNIKSKLSKKERQFCCNYVNTGNVKESAIKAGFSATPEKVGFALLEREDISKEIDQMYSERRKNMVYRACSGYERLAFGSIVDAIKLLAAKDVDELSLDNMDFFNIAEIKIIKGGGMEIKFFDRLRALEKLEQSDLSKANEITPFYRALEQGANAITLKEIQEVE